MRPHPRRTSTDPSHPRAWATDDRSGFVGNHADMCWQYEWAGTGLINKHILVYPDQLDIPQRQLGTIILPTDPLPIMNARTEQYAIDEVWPMLLEVKTSYDQAPIFFEKSTLSSVNKSAALSLETSTEP